MGSSDEETIWEDKNGNEYTAYELSDRYIINILKRFDEQDVSMGVGSDLELVIKEARKRGIKQECNYTELNEGDGYEYWDRD